MIPHIIHQVFFTNNEKNGAGIIPKVWKGYRKTFQKLHPTWQHILWNYENAFPFMQKYYPKWQQFFRDIPYPVAQADIIRYMVLEHCGGWYFDMDCEALQTLDIFCKHEILLPLESSIAFGNSYDQIGNAILASKPKHAFWHKVLMRIWEHKNEIVQLTQKEKNRIITLTGPKLVQEVFENLDTTTKASYTVIKREHFHMPFAHPLTHSQYKKLRKNSEVFVLHHSYSIWRTTNTKSLFRRKEIARNPLLHMLSRFWALVKKISKTLVNHTNF